MQSRLNNYMLGNRFFTIGKNAVVNNNTFLTLCEKKEYFCEDVNFLNELNDGDIVYINMYGVIKRIYEYSSKSVDLLTTIHCNSNCIMCPISEVSRKQNEEGYYEWLVEFISLLPSDIEHICLTGGEPTMLRQRLFYIFDLLYQNFQHSEYQFLTNGRSVANMKFCTELVEHIPPSTLIGIPLHAGNPVLYDKIAQVNGGFVQVVNGIKNLLAKNMRVEIRVVVSKLNADNMFELANFIVSNFPNVYCVTFMGLEMMGNAIKNSGEVWLEYNEATNACYEAIDLLMSNGIDVMLYNFPLCCINRKYWCLSKQSISTFKVKFYDECDICEVKEACSGFFQSTFRTKNTTINPVVISNV